MRADTVEMCRKTSNPHVEECGSGSIAYWVVLQLRGKFVSGERVCFGGTRCGCCSVILWWASTTGTLVELLVMALSWTSFRVVRNGPAMERTAGTWHKSLLQDVKICAPVGRCL